MQTKVVRGEGQVVTELQRVLSAETPLADWLARHGTVLKREGDGAVGLAEIAGQNCYVKVFPARSRLQQIGFGMGLARAQRAFDAARQLATNGIRVPEPLACLRLPSAMVLVTAALGGEDLKALWLKDIAREDWPLIMERAASALADLHGAGFIHGDCKWSNLFWSHPEVILVDLDAVRRSRSRRNRGRDLARFVLNAEELSLAPGHLEVFLQTYAAKQGTEKASVVEWLAPALVELRRRHEQKYGRRGVRLLEDVR